MNYELDINEGELKIGCKELENIQRTNKSAMDSLRFTDPWTKPIRWLILGTSMAAILCLILRNSSKTKWLQMLFNKQNISTFNPNHINYFYKESMVSGINDIETIS